MFKLGLKRLSAVTALTLFATTISFANPTEIKLETPPIEKRAIDGGVKYKVEGDHYESYRVNPDAYKMEKYNFGREATKNEIKARDIDVRYDWQGLPDGKGSVEEGDELYAKHCEMCHGEMGSGGRGYPTLVGGPGTLKNQMLQPGDEPPIKDNRGRLLGHTAFKLLLGGMLKLGMPFSLIPTRFKLRGENFTQFVALTHNP